jgi:hypothetical protein
MSFSDKLNEITSNYINNVQTEIMNKVSDTTLYLSLTIWQSTIDIVSILLLIDIYWCCLCMMISRERVSIPPFGDAKPIDHLFFICSFYFVIRLVALK